MHETLPIDLGQLTDIGLMRKTNEDTILTLPEAEREDQGGRLFIVADGVGGESHGDVASSIAAQSTADTFYAYMQSRSEALLGTALYAALRSANHRVYDEASSRQAAGHMATTLVVAAMREHDVAIAWVGDSRAYVMRYGSKRLEQITYDHSQVEEQVRLGIITPEEAMNHPRRNVLSRSIGGRPIVDVDVVVGTVAPGDVLLLCSDGLTNYVTDDEIAAQLWGTMNSQAAAEQLVTMANARGGKDNISVIVVHIGHRDIHHDDMPTVNFYEMDTELKTRPAQTNDPRRDTVELEAAIDDDTEPVPPSSEPEGSRRGWPLILMLLILGAASAGLVLLTQISS